MADRDPRLGPYGIYDAEMIDRVGLSAALRATANHLEWGADHIAIKHGIHGRSLVAAEAARLRLLAATAGFP